MSAFAAPARAGIRLMQLVGDGDKVGPGFVAKDAEALRLFGMRNETLAFQILVQADGAGADFDLHIEGLDDALVSLFREDSIPIHERSHELVWKPGSAAQPAIELGALPDRLVPIKATGLSLSANQAQVYWVDVWLGPALRAEDRQIAVEIIGDAACTGCRQEGSLELVDRQMPDTPTSRTMLWFSGGDPNDDTLTSRYFANPSEASPADLQALRRKHYQLARQHRITLFWGQHTELTEELRDLLSGAAFSKDAGYQGPGQGLGQDLLVFEAYGGELSAEQAGRWLNVAKGYPSLLDVFVYVIDEPRKGDYPEANRRIAASKPMRSFVTSEYTPALQADIFAAPAWQYRASEAKAAAAANKALWIYNGMRPFSGSFATDDVAVAPRVNPWIQYQAGIERWFYWEATYYNDFQGKRGPVDLLADGINFTNRHGDRVNGDGLLIYPGRDRLFPASDAGIDGPLASIRLKNWRRGIEDVEYLVMARAAGFDAEVDALLVTLLPRVLDASREGQAVSWPEEGQRWTQARRYLFELLRDGKTSIELQSIARPAGAVQEASSSLRFILATLGLVAFGLVVLVGIGLSYARRRARSRS